MSKQLVVLLSRQRSGTNALRSVLDSHPQVHCFYEILSYAPNDLARPESFVSYAKQECGAQFADPKNHLGIFEAFIDKLHAIHDKAISIVDVKLNSTHHISAEWNELHERPLFNWLRSNGVPIIRLRRNNYLKVLCSDEFARLRNKWHYSNAKPDSNPRVVMPNPDADMDYLLQRIKSLHLEDQIVDATFKDHDRTCDLTYSEMFPEMGCPIASSVLHRISDFLGIEYQFDPVPNFRKSLPRPMREVIENWRQVSNFLQSTEFEHLLIDEPMFLSSGQGNHGVENATHAISAENLLARLGR